MHKNLFDGYDVTRLIPIVNSIRGYHSHKIIGIDKIPKEGPAIIVCNHSLATYDIVLLLTAVYEETGRFTRQLMDRIFRKVPVLYDFVEALGARVANPKTAEALLKNGELVGVAPGGMREALRPSSEKYKILWGRRKGFIRLSINAQAPIYLAACANGDDLYDIYENKLTALAYKYLKVPLPFAKGFGLTPIPKPVKLTHIVSDPIYPPVKADTKREFTKQVNQLHKTIIKQMNELMKESLDYQDKQKHLKVRTST